MPDDNIRAQTSECVSCKGTKSRDWYAWNNLMLPKPDDFHVTGQVYVSNPGIVAELRYKEPQGINPDYLLLDIYLIQRPGIWPRVFTWADVRYDQIPSKHKYTNVEIFCEGENFAAMKVEDIH